MFAFSIINCNKCCHKGTCTFCSPGISLCYKESSVNPPFSLLNFSVYVKVNVVFIAVKCFHRSNVSKIIGCTEISELDLLKQYYSIVRVFERTGCIIL